MQTEKYAANISKVRKPQDDEYYDEEEENDAENYQAQQLQTIQTTNMKSLESWLEKVYPRFAAILDANAMTNAFDSYKPLWVEEREDINEAYCLRTNFDFKEANKAVQKTLHKMGESVDAPS